MAISKQRANYLLHRVYRVLDGDEIYCRIAKLRNHRGMEIHGIAHNELGLFFVDPRHSLLPTVIHEALHVLYPEWSERKVMSMEEQICKKMSHRQWVNLLTKLAYKVQRG